MTDDLTRRMYERAAELSARLEEHPDDAYALRWSQIMQWLADAAIARQMEREER